jgi:hypothetical protein
MVICASPSEDVEFIDEIPEIVDNCRSIGDATDEAMVSGLAPGNCAVIWMVGKSTAGSAATGSSREAKMPKSINDAVICVVSTGRRIQVSEIFMDQLPATLGVRTFTRVPFDSNN